jgi:hypothetical protein
MVDFSPVEDPWNFRNPAFRKLALLELAYYARQMKNLEAFVPIEWMIGDAFTCYCWATGALLARAHARTGDAAVIAGYLRPFASTRRVLIVRRPDGERSLRNWLPQSSKDG